MGFGAKPHKKLLLTKNILTLALSFFGGLRKELVWQQQGYYPFGMALGATLATAEPNRMMYNGKELQDYPLNGMELGWYDYGARFYDPMLGRWHVVDPMAEEYYNLSPHAYCANNPIKFIDPDGRSIGAITSSFVTPDGTLIEHRDDGDPRVYLVRDPDAWRKNGSKKEDAEHVGYEYPEVDYASMVGKQALYYPSKAPFMPGFLNDGPIEQDYTLEELFIPVFGFLKAIKFGKGIYKLIPKKISLGKQGKHILGHNNFIKGRSILKANPQQLLDKVHAKEIKSISKVGDSMV